MNESYIVNVTVYGYHDTYTRTIYAINIYADTYIHACIYLNTCTYRKCERVVKKFIMTNST